MSGTARASTTMIPALPAGKLGELLSWGQSRLDRSLATPRLDAEVLLSSVTGLPRSSLHAFPEREVEEHAAEAFASLVGRRAIGEPVAYLLGVREFYSLPLKVTPDVLVPRPETELLVDLSLDLLRSMPAVARVLDLGTGSGAIALALKANRPQADVTASDFDPAALAVAGMNSERLGLSLQLVESDWFESLERRRFDIVVANPPYIESTDKAFDGPLRFEPRHALDGGKDGLDSYRRILAGAAAQLAPAGLLLLEHGFDQRDGLADLADRSGFRVIATHEDLNALPRVLVLASKSHG